METCLNISDSVCFTQIRATQQASDVTFVWTQSVISKPVACKC